MASIIKANQLQDFGGNSIITSDGAGTITLSSGMNTAVAAGTNNTPAFLVTRSGNQSISLNTDTKVQWDSETFDTDNAFDSSTNYRFTPQVAGKYYLFSNIYLANGSNANNTTYTPKIFKNGSKVIESHIDHRTAGIGYQQSVPVAGLVEANGSSDYFEIFANGNWTGGSINVTAQSFFGGYKIIGA